MRVLNEGAKLGEDLNRFFYPQQKIFPGMKLEWNFSGLKRLFPLFQKLHYSSQQQKEIEIERGGWAKRGEERGKGRREVGERKK